MTIVSSSSSLTSLLANPSKGNVREILSSSQSIVEGNKDGYNAEACEKIRHVRADQGLAGEVLRTGQCINMMDATKSPCYSNYLDKLDKTETASVLAIPLKHNELGTIGVLEMMNKMGEEKQFSPQDEVSDSNSSLKANRPM